MADVIWQPAALDDLNDIVGYLEQFDPIAAEGIVDRLYRCVESLAMYPARGRPAATDRREMTTVPPYVLIYQLDGETVYILSIRHGARRPLD